MNPQAVRIQPLHGGGVPDLPTTAVGDHLVGEPVQTCHAPGSPGSMTSKDIRS
ncbi:hypothetical protein ACIA5D_50690 [Actinoplanes sp. NPDC051513]|uniref:hypothetical protein n=1 Tax=Actinoplanes sp. NPDC051513 TaxID=3363908 RepID=UPI0037A94BF4